MKKLLTVLLILTAYYASGQTPSMVPLRGDTVKIYKQGGSAELVLLNATRDTAGFLYNTGNGITQFRRALKKLNDTTYLVGPDTLKIHASGTGGITDTASLSLRIDQRVKYTDTAAMLTNYRHWLQGYLKAADITGKVNVSDTAAMLTNYRHWLQGYLKAADITGKVNVSDTAAMLTNYRHWLQGYLKAADITGKVNVSDTAAMLTNYRHWLQGYLKAADITGKLNISDTAAMLTNYRHWLQGYLKAADIAGKLNISDTVNLRFRPFAGVNVTLSGTYPSITINTDTSTGPTKLATQGYIDRALAVNDTLKTRWPLYGIPGGSNPDTLAINKFTGSDSGYITPAMWALKLSISDTSGMLSPYLRKVDTTAKWVNTTYKKSGTDSIFQNKGGTISFLYRVDSAAGSSYTFSKSVVNTAGDVTLVNDSTTLVKDRVYAYQGGSRGWKAALLADSSGIKTGSLFYWNGTNMVPIAPGTSSQVLHGGTAPVFKDTTAIGANISDSTLKWVTKNGDSTIYRLATSDTVKGTDAVAHRKNIVGDATASGKAWRLYGTSITETATPTNVTAAQSYATLTPQAFGFIPDNRAKAGTTTMQYSAGDSSVENKIYTIPTFSAAHGLLTLEGPGLNDFYVPFGHSFDTVALKAMLNKWLDTAHTARGWPYDSIAIISGPYTTSTQYPHAHDANRAARTVCETRGVAFIDMESFMQSRSGYFTPGDSVHSNSLGHQYYMANILKTLSNFKKVGYQWVHGGGLYDDSLQIIGQFRTGNWTPSSGTWNNILGGKTVTGDQLYVGGVTNRNSARIETETSLNQVGISIYEAGGKQIRGYGGDLQIFDGTNTAKYRGNELNIGNVTGNYTVLGGSSLKVAEFGSSTGVILNGDKYQGGIFQQKGTGSSYLIFATPPTDRVGLKDSVPQQLLSVNGSGSFADTLWGKGKFKLSGITQSASSKVLHWDPSTNMVTWADTSVTSGASNTFSKSVVNTAGDVTLVNDSTSLTKNKVYGYQTSTGTRGWKDAVPVNLTSPAQGDVLTYKASDTSLVNTTRPAFLLYNNYRADTIQTTDATQTTIATIATAGSAYFSQGTLEIMLDASSSTAGISGKRIYRFVNNAGTLSIVDQTDIAPDYLSTLTTASWTVTVSGSNLLVRVTGQASQTINWITLSKIHWSQTAL